MYRYILLLSVSLLVLASIILTPRFSKGSAILVEQSTWVPDGVVDDGYDDFDKFRFSTSYPMYYLSTPNETNRGEVLNFLFSSAGKLLKVEGVPDNDELAKAYGYASENDLKNAFKRELKPYELFDMTRLAGHIRLLNDAIRAANEWTIMFEDLVSPILVPLWDLSLDETIDAIVAQASGEERFVQLGYDFFSTQDLYSAMEVWRLDPFTRTVTCPYCRGAIAYLVNKKGAKTLLDGISRNGKIAVPCGPLVDHMNSTCDPGILLPAVAGSSHRIRTPPVFTYRYIDAPERNWLDQFQHVADAMQWAAIGEELYNTKMDGFPQYYPFTRWKVNECEPPK